MINMCEIASYFETLARTVQTPKPYICPMASLLMTYRVTVQDHSMSRMGPTYNSNFIYLWVGIHRRHVQTSKC